jgi:hypothetical protein
MKTIVIFFTLLLAYISGCKENPVEVKPENRRPIILSLTSFPEVIGPTDSVIIVCNAMDPDGDTLVYDWTTDGKSRIKEAAYPDWSIFNTYENWCVVYPKNLNSVLIDTCWVQVFARDRKGKSDVQLVSFILSRDSS